MPRKACCCGGGNYVAIPCRAWGHAVFVGYQGFSGIQGASAIQGYDEYFGNTATALFKKQKSVFGLCGPWLGYHPFYKFYSGGFVVGNAGFGSITPAPLKIVGYTGCINTGPGSQNWGGYNGTTCYKAIFETDNDRPVYYKLWGAGGGAVSRQLYGGNGAYTQLEGVYNQNNIACVGMGGFGKSMMENFTGGWTGTLQTYKGGGGQGYPVWGGGAAFVSDSFYPDTTEIIVGAGGGAGRLIAGPGHGGATYGRDATPTEGGKGACGDTPGKGGCGAEDGILQTGGRGVTALFYGGGGGGGGLGGGGGGGRTGYAGGGGSSEVSKWSRSATDDGPPNICDPYFWIGATDQSSQVGNKVIAGLGGWLFNERNQSLDIPSNSSEHGYSGKVAVVYASMRCLCDESLDTIPEQTYICLNQNQYDTIIQQAQASPECYGNTAIMFGGATGLSAYGGMTEGFLQWTFGEGEIPKMISFYYEDELYYLIGQCPVLCDPAYQIPEDANLSLVDCKLFGDCCKALLATPYCKIPVQPSLECFSFPCPSNCEPERPPSPFYVCRSDEGNPEMPNDVFWTKKNGYYYIVTPTQGWVPFGEDLYEKQTISEVILGEPCCSDTQEGCSGGIHTTSGTCCKVVDKIFDKPHPGRASINATIVFDGNPEIPSDGNCDAYPACCRTPTPYNDNLTSDDIEWGETKSFPPKSSFSGSDCGEGSDCGDNFDRSLSYYVSFPGDIPEIENPYIPVLRIESSCNCIPTCTLPDLFITDPYATQYDCEQYQGHPNPIVIVNSGGLDDIVDALNSVSNGKYTVTKLSSQNFWFGIRSRTQLGYIIPGDELTFEDLPQEAVGTNGVKCVRIYYAKSPLAGVSIATCGSLLSNCFCYYRVSPSFIQSNGMTDPNSSPGCAKLPTYKTLVEWQNNPATTPLLTLGSYCGNLYLCSGYYSECMIGFWDGSLCSFTAKSNI